MLPIRPVVVATLVALAAASHSQAQPTLQRDLLGRMPDSIRVFVDELYSSNPRERAEAACQLSNRPREAVIAIPVLVTMLSDDVVVDAIECDMSPWLRRQLRVSQDARNWSRTSPAREAAEALGEIGDPAVPSLVQALRHADRKTRKFAADGLGDVRHITDVTNVVSALSTALRDAHAEVRDRAAWALGEIEHAAAVPALTTAVADVDSRVRRTAVWALGEIEDAAAVPALEAVLKDGDVGVREKAAWALGEIEDASALPALIAALKDAHWEVRKTAAWALGEIEDVRAIEPLEAIRYDPHVEVRQAVMRALRELRDQ